MAEMRKMIFGALFVGLIVFGFNSFWSDIMNNYGISQESNLTSLVKINETLEEIEAFGAKLETDQITFGGLVGATIEGAYIGGKVFISSIFLFPSLINDAGGLVDIPTIVILTLSGAVSALAIMIIIGWFLGRQI